VLVVIDWKFSIIKPKIFFTDLVLHKLAGNKNKNKNKNDSLVRATKTTQFLFRLCLL
jgi:hypothetical protein